METLVTVVHVIVATFLIIVVLIQGGNQGGVSAAFGGGNTQGVFGATGATSFLGKLTYAAALIFMLTSISLTIMHGQGGDVGLSERLKKATENRQETLPIGGAVPAPATAPAPAAEVPTPTAQ